MAKHPRAGYKNYVFMCQPSSQERAMKEAREYEVFQSVHTPDVTIKIRTGKERKREVRETYLLPGFFFGRTKHWEPEAIVPKLRYSVKLMTTFGWGWCKDEEIERMSGLRLDADVKNAVTAPKLMVGEKAALLGWAFKSMAAQEVIAVNEGQNIVMESPLFGGVPLKVSVGNSLYVKSRV